jgi:hypothetical protein
MAESSGKIGIQIQPPQPISKFLDEEMTRTEKSGSSFLPQNL